MAGVGKLKIRSNPLGFLGRGVRSTSILRDIVRSTQILRCTNKSCLAIILQGLAGSDTRFPSVLRMVPADAVQGGERGGSALKVYS